VSGQAMASWRLRRLGARRSTHLDEHVGGVDDLVQLAPDASGLALHEDILLCGVHVLALDLDVGVLLLDILRTRLFRLEQQLTEVAGGDFGALAALFLAKGLFERFHLTNLINTDRQLFPMYAFLLPVAFSLVEFL
jgi:hypothetical protein